MASNDDLVKFIVELKNKYGKFNYEIVKDKLNKQTLSIFSAKRKCGLANYTACEELLPPKFNRISHLKDNLFLVFNTPDKGAIYDSRKKQFLTEFCYYAVINIYGSLIEVVKLKSGKFYYGVIDINGKEIIPCEFRDITYKAKKGCFEVKDDSSQIKVFDVSSINTEQSSGGAIKRKP